MFDWFDGYAAWRILNALMALHGLVLLFLIMRKHWSKSDPAVRFLMQGMAGLLAATAVASIEAIVQGNPIGVRTSLFTAATFWCVLGLRDFEKKNRNLE